MVKEIFCIVSGRVQGVFFRNFVCDIASALNLVGTVKNLTDGTVEAVAQGEEKALDEFIEKLKKGPMLAKVEAVTLKWREPSESFFDFKIIGDF